MSSDGGHGRSIAKGEGPAAATGNLALQPLRAHNVRGPGTLIRPGVVPPVWVGGSGQAARNWEGIAHRQVGRAYRLESAHGIQSDEVVIARNRDRATVRRGDAPEPRRRQVARERGDGADNRIVSRGIDGRDDHAIAVRLIECDLGSVIVSPDSPAGELAVNERPNRLDAPGHDPVFVLTADVHGLIAREALSGARCAQQRLMAKPFGEAFRQALDGLGLVPGRAKIGDEPEVGH